MKSLKSEIARVVSSIFIMFLLILSMYRIGNCDGITNTAYFYPPTQSSLNGNPVSFIFNGTVYPEGWWFNQVQAGLYNASGDENFIINAVSTFTNGTPSDIVNMWAPDDQAGVQADVSNSTIFAASRGFYNGVTASAFIAKILYGSNEIFIIQHSGSFGNIMLPYVVTEIDGNLYLTQQLQSDPFFTYITQKYIETLPYKTVQ